MSQHVCNYWPPAGDWRTSLPEQVGVNSDLLYEADRYIRSAAKRINSLILIKNGQMVFEKYYNGFHRDKPQHICSVTKGIVSALVGIGIDQGYIGSVEQTVVDIFGDESFQSMHYMMQGVTVEHLLTMTSGIYSRYNSNGNEPMWDRMLRSGNWAEFILHLPVVEKRFGRFDYTSMNSHLLSTIVAKTSGMGTCEFANRYLFDPIGIGYVHSVQALQPDFPIDEDILCWKSDPQGCSIGGFDLRLRPIDLARLGYLYLRMGEWEGKQIISRTWIEQSVKPHVKGEHSDYGYQWWVSDGYYSAQGFGGQSVYVLPAIDSVVVMTSKSDSRGTYGRGTDVILNKFILPSIKG